MHGGRHSGGLLPQESILVGAFCRRSAFQAAPAGRKLAIATELAAATLHAGHGPTASLSHALGLRRGRVALDFRHLHTRDVQTQQQIFTGIDSLQAGGQKKPKPGKWVTRLGPFSISTQSPFLVHTKQLIPVTNKQPFAPDRLQVMYSTLRAYL